jgi:hypothetical protein
MRKAIPAANPGIDSNNDQAHAASLLARDLGNTLFLNNALEDASVVAKSVRNRYRLTFAYQKAAGEQNANEIGPAERRFKSVKRYPQSSATHFLYVRDVVDTTAATSFHFAPFSRRGAARKSWSGTKRSCERSAISIPHSAQSQFAQKILQ